LARGFRIVHCDEMMVTRSTFPRREWAAFKENICLDLSALDTRPIAVLGAVSREFGIELMMPFEKSVNIPKFKMFLDAYRSKYPFDNIMLVFDQLKVHTSLESRARIEELGFEVAWFPVYSPEYNGIESVWHMHKSQLKKRRLHLIQTG
jgi:hypothetical protein